MWRTKMLPIAGALVAGGLLFSFYEAQQSVFDPDSTPWLVALFAFPAPILLVVIALRKFGSKHTGSVMLAGFVAWILCIHKVSMPDGTANPNIFALPTAVLFAGPFVSLVGFGITLALLIGSKPVRYCLRFALLAGVAIGAYSLAATIAERRRVETQELPSVLRRIYEAEMYYSAGRPDKGFTCDVTQLQAIIAMPRAQYAGAPGWYAKTYPNQSVAELTARNYTAQVVCPIERIRFKGVIDGVRQYEQGDGIPHHFHAEGRYYNNDLLIGFLYHWLVVSIQRLGDSTVVLSIDETGKLKNRPLGRLGR